MVRSLTHAGLLAALGLLFAGQLSGQELNGRFLDAAIDSIVEAHMASGQVPGLTVAADRGGDLLHNQSYGHADLELGAELRRAARGEDLRAAGYGGHALLRPRPHRREPGQGS